MTGSRVSFALTKRCRANFDPYPETHHQAGCGVGGGGGGGCGRARRRFSVDALSGVVTFDVAPALGVAVTAGFLFDVPVRFDIDRLDVELPGFDAAEVPTIP